MDLFNQTTRHRLIDRITKCYPLRMQKPRIKYYMYRLLGVVPTPYHSPNLIYPTLPYIPYCTLLYPTTKVSTKHYFLICCLHLLRSNSEALEIFRILFHQSLVHLSSLRLQESTHKFYIQHTLISTTHLQMYLYRCLTRLLPHVGFRMMPNLYMVHHTLSPPGSPVANFST